MNPLPGMSPVHSFASWPILRGGGCTFSQTRHGRNTAKAKSTQPTSTLTEIPPTYTQVFAHCPLKARNQRGRRRQPGEFVNLVRYLSCLCHTMHIFATIAPPGGVHIFACSCSSRKFAPKACIFRILPPYAHNTVCERPLNQIQQRMSAHTRHTHTAHGLYAASSRPS